MENAGATQEFLVHILKKVMNHEAIKATDIVKYYNAGADIYKYDNYALKLVLYTGKRRDIMSCLHMFLQRKGCFPLGTSIHDATVRPDDILREVTGGTSEGLHDINKFYLLFNDERCPIEVVLDREDIAAKTKFEIVDTMLKYILDNRTMTSKTNATKVLEKLLYLDTAGVRDMVKSIKRHLGITLDRQVVHRILNDDILDVKRVAQMNPGVLYDIFTENFDMVQPDSMAIFYGICIKFRDNRSPFTRFTHYIEEYLYQNVGPKGRELIELTLLYCTDRFRKSSYFKWMSEGTLSR